MAWPFFTVRLPRVEPKKILTLTWRFGNHPPLDPEVSLKLSEHIRQALQREVDLVDLRRTHGALLSEILTRGSIIVLRDPSSYEQLLKRMWYEREDDGRYIEKTLRERLRAWEK